MSCIVCNPDYEVTGLDHASDCPNRQQGPRQLLPHELSADDWRLIRASLRGHSARLIALLVSPLTPLAARRDLLAVAEQTTGLAARIRHLGRYPEPPSAKGT